jgi:hypothetical protein
MVPTPHPHNLGVPGKSELSASRDPSVTLEKATAPDGVPACTTSVDRVLRHLVNELSNTLITSEARQR